MSTNHPSLALHALGGQAAPPDLADDLRRLAAMPPEALGKLWQALGPCLADRIAEDTERLLDVFCSAYRLSGDDLARAIKACRFLLQSAAKLDVEPELLGADLDDLCPEAPVVREVLLAGYEPAKRQMREGIVAAALAGHGKLLVRAEWRIDTIEASERGAKLRTRVAMLTLHYHEGTEAKRITLQVLPDMMGQLKGICEEVLG